MVDMNAIGDRNLGEMPGRIFLSIKNHWNSCHSVHQGWRAFIAELDGHFVMTDSDVAIIERENDSSRKLLNSLSVRGMSIRQFAHYAVLARDSFVMNMMNVYVPIQIIDNLQEEMHVLENDRLILNVRAFGNPPPHYQWYKDSQRIDDEIQNTFEVPQASPCNAGDYCCVVYSEDMQQMLQSNHTSVVVDPPAELEIIDHPSSCHVRFGHNAVFKCEVWGGADLVFQWYKDYQPLCDTAFIQGSQSKRLTLNVDSEDWQGWYHCEITSISGQCKPTYRALLQLEERMLDHRTGTTYKATDKVVLLIGCSDYRGDKLLTAPHNDVRTLSSIFQSLGFKVMSLLNLTRNEMISAVHEFKELVSKDVYCVFYFCGHGYEASGYRFLVPTDAPIAYDHTHCIAAEQILNVLLKKNPQICCMILDTCRKIKTETKVPPIDLSAVQRGNQLVCYATSFGLAAYEGRERGILVSHLKKFLANPISIESVFTRLRESFGEDKKVNENNPDNPHKQIPDVKSNLTEPRRSLADPIDYHGYTEQFNKRQMAWQMAHEKPEARELCFHLEGFTVKVQLEFQQEFSNMLKVYVSVIDPGPAEECIAYVSAVPVEVAEKGTNKTVMAGSRTLRQTFVTITNIQKLKATLHIEVTAKCRLTPNGPELQQTVKTDLGQPLVATLALWRERPDLSVRREAVEQEEGDEEQGLHSTEG